MSEDILLGQLVEQVGQQACIHVVVRERVRARDLVLEAAVGTIPQEQLPVCIEIVS